VQVDAILTYLPTCSLSTYSSYRQTSKQVSDQLQIGSNRRRKYLYLRMNLITNIKQGKKLTGSCISTHISSRSNAASNHRPVSDIVPQPAGCTDVVSSASLTRSQESVAGSASAWMASDAVHLLEIIHIKRSGKTSV